MTIPFWRQIKHQSKYVQGKLAAVEAILLIRELTLDLITQTEPGSAL